MHRLIKKSLIFFLLLTVIGLTGGVLALAHMDMWLFTALAPGHFDDEKTPVRPDFNQSKNWAALPSLHDDSDISLPELPAIKPEESQADVFYIHPTTALKKQWNVDPQKPEVIKATARGAMLIQASVFNASCAIYAPRYRQANGKAFVEISEDGDHAIDVAYSDVLSAFEVFVKKYNHGRPFILASHSQGSVLAARLLKQRIWHHPEAHQLVAAYLIGGPITQKYLGADIPVCASAEQTSCVIVYNARGPHSKTHQIDFFNRDYPNARNKMQGFICVNPLSWTNNKQLSPSSMHRGALFFDSEKPKIIDHFAAAQCRGGKLLVTNMKALPKRDFMSGLLLWVLGPEYYHPIEYQLFYVNLRENIAKRVGAFVKKNNSDVY